MKECPVNIRSRIVTLAIVALLFPLPACEPSIGDATAETGDESDSAATTPTGGAEDGGEYMPCTNDNPCPAGQFCFNGLCAPGCNSNGDCAADQYCDTEFDKLCHNKEVATCPDVACPTGQECVNGFCSAGAGPACEWMPNGEDGCDDHSLCYEAEGEASQCYAFPACAEDDTCPKGTAGAVCNVGLIPSKAKICLIGYCLDSAEHCPAGDSCVKFGGEDVGTCSSGGPGELCVSAADCVSGECFGAMSGFPGVCA
jgi:hypothetical protein